MSGRTGIWGKKEWQKSSYQPTPETHKGRWIFSNATKQDLKWTPNGQDVKLTIGSKEIDLKPGELYAFHPKDNKKLTVKAKPQLSKAGMGSGTLEIDNPLIQDDHHIWIWASTTSGFKLTFYPTSRSAPR
jgi:hypothetical protein